MEFLEEFVLPDPSGPRGAASIVVSVDLASSGDLRFDFGSSEGRAYGLHISPETVRGLAEALRSSLHYPIQAEFVAVEVDGAACRLIVTSNPGEWGEYVPAHGGEPEALVLVLGHGFTRAALLGQRETVEFHNALAEGYESLDV